METTKREKTIKELFLGNCWKYLHDNFHKFSEPNKIKIALTLAQKDLPTTLQGAVNVNHMPTIKKGEGKLEFSIGADATQDTRHTEQAAPDN